MILRPKPVQYPFIVLLDVTLSRLFCIALIVTKTGGATERKDIVVKIIRPKLSWDQLSQDHCQITHSLFPFEMKVVIDTSSSPTMETRLEKGYLLGR